jgi:hypothetical protein
MLLVMAGACGSDGPAVMDGGEFIDVMIELRSAELEAADDEAFAARRDSILEAAGVTDSMLIEFARVRGRDVAYMAAVWDSIDRVVNEVPVGDTGLEPDTMRAP